MSRRLREGLCQGNFAASVKAILPITRWGVLAVQADSGYVLHEFPENYGEDP
jgi:hypothetical protein